MLSARKQPGRRPNRIRGRRGRIHPEAGRDGGLAAKVEVLIRRFATTRGAAGREARGNVVLFVHGRAASVHHARR